MRYHDHRWVLHDRLFREEEQRSREALVTQKSIAAIRNSIHANRALDGDVAEPSVSKRCRKLIGREGAIERAPRHVPAMRGVVLGKPRRQRIDGVHAVGACGGKR
jgi:hypothetical protein